LTRFVSVLASPQLLELNMMMLNRLSFGLTVIKSWLCKALMLYGWIVCVCVSEPSCGKRTVQVFPVVEKRTDCVVGSHRMNVYMSEWIYCASCADHSTL